MSNISKFALAKIEPYMVWNDAILAACESASKTKASNKNLRIDKKILVSEDWDDDKGFIDFLKSLNVGTEVKGYRGRHSYQISYKDIMPKEHSLHDSKDTAIQNKCIGTFKQILSSYDTRAK